MHIEIFDIETNGIKDFKTLLGLKTIHCIGMASPDGEPELVPVEEALERLRLADIIVGHNIQDFDVRAIQRLHPDWNTDAVIRDTLIMCRMLWPDIQNEDWQTPEFPKNLVGRQSLKAWGVRLGIHKGEFAQCADWDEYTDEMGEYCLQDVRVTQALWNRIKKENPPARPTVLEHEFAAIVSQQERNGFGFDINAAKELHSSLLHEKDQLKKRLQGQFPSQIIPMKTPAYYEDPITKKRYTRKSDAPMNIRKALLNGELRVKEVPFNPGSRMQIADGLIKKHGWNPTEFTGEGRARVDESILRELEYPEATDLILYLTIAKRLGQIADGRESWLKVEKDGRIYGRVNPCGAVTSRCTHSRPNMAQVPRVGAPWGKECRSLFVAPEGCVLVGVDASGLELRCLAHYTYSLDGGHYAKEILHGDIHTSNQRAAGLPDRDSAKTFIYALCYGAGDAKIGSIVGGGVDEGRKIKREFFRKISSLKRIQDGVKNRLKQQDHLVGIDGRKLKIRSPHSALNTLLQSAGAIAMKEATCLIHRAFKAEGWTEADVMQVGHIHDEVQFQAREEIADHVGRISVQAIRDAGESLGFRCPLDGEYRIGHNWAETH
mgnify:CR=1 FL=1|jgi:DNA polymerase I-like protein with 3'-5' exonuclease and polymerase domains